MPNWCEGNLRVRGKWEDIVRFFTEEVRALIPPSKESYIYVDVNPKIITKSKGTLILGKSKGTEITEFWIKDTCRNFIRDSEIVLENWYPDEPEHEIVAFVDHFRAAWGIEADAYIPIAKKYNVDIRLFGWECGMQFGEKVTILRDGTVNYESFHYDNWDWDCPFPDLGG